MTSPKMSRCLFLLRDRPAACLRCPFPAWSPLCSPHCLVNSSTTNSMSSQTFKMLQPNLVAVSGLTSVRSTERYNLFLLVALKCLNCKVAEQNVKGIIITFSHYERAAGSSLFGRGGKPQTKAQRLFRQPYSIRKE